jgi:3'-phosphoadenosine 5'-phosphosulfate sulfotransferase (PAPS reductase)/FAD synthetase
MKNSTVTGTGFKFSRLRDKRTELANPKEYPLVIAFSGGRTSGMMLRHYLDTEKEKPIVLFANTGKERDETLDFVHEVETQWNINVVWLELDIVKTDLEKIKKYPSTRTRKNLIPKKTMLWYKQVNYETAARHQDEETPFDKVITTRQILPNAVSRYCSSEMKVRTMQRYLWDKGIYRMRNAIGFRSDEPDRGYDLLHSTDRDKMVSLEFPLMKLGVTVEDVTRFWEQQDFDLQLQPHEGNCHLCFLKKRRSLLLLLSSRPDLAKWWKEVEESKSVDCHGAGGQFNRNFTIEDLLKQTKDYEFDIQDTRDAMQCACTTAMSLAEIKEEEGGDTNGQNSRPKPGPKADSKRRTPPQKKRPLPKKKPNSAKR